MRGGRGADDGADAAAMVIRGSCLQWSPGIQQKACSLEDVYLSAQLRPPAARLYILTYIMRLPLPLFSEE